MVKAFPQPVDSIRYFALDAILPLMRAARWCITDNESHECSNRLLLTTYVGRPVPGSLYL